MAVGPLGNLLPPRRPPPDARKGRAGSQIGVASPRIGEPRSRPRTPDDRPDDSRHDCVVTDSRWTYLEEAKPRLVAAFAGRGVVRVEYVAALPEPDVWVWLGTSTDAQRDSLRADPGLADEGRQVLLSRPAEGMPVEGVTVQSVEAVARDYAGSWFYAMR